MISIVHFPQVGHNEGWDIATRELNKRYGFPNVSASVLYNHSISTLQALDSENLLQIVSQNFS
jgi:uncharacterized protein YajQ (UPF0234 family)